MQAMYSKQIVDHACNINDEMNVSGKEKATSLPDILLVDFNQCEVCLRGTNSQFTPPDMRQLIVSDGVN